MPFYEYECPHCRYHDEVLQKISDAPLKKCPNCGKNGLRKLISAPVFRLKGSGWYETDFKSDKENKRNLASAEKEETDKKAETKAEAKPGAKADATKTEPAGPAADKSAAKPVKPSPGRAKPKPRTTRRARR